MQITGKKSILKKLAQMGGSTLASRILGIIRETLTARYLLPGAQSDAFVASFKIPNSLRKIFAEGAISGAFIPTLVRIFKYSDRSEANKAITLLLFLVQFFVLSICVFISCRSEWFLHCTLPGFNSEQLSYAVPLLRILIFFIVPISYAAILGSGLQALGDFFVPAFAPIIYNGAFIIGLCLCIYFKLSLTVFAYIVLFAGFLYALIHFYAYKKIGLGFALWHKSSYGYIKEVLFKFFPVLFTVGVVEFNSYIDSYLASGMETGTVTLLYFAHRFSQIPLGVFGSAFSTILLPYFSQIGTYAPRRLGFFIHEALKLIFYITIPATIVLAFFSYDIFFTLFKFSNEQTFQAGQLLALASSSIFFHSINKTFVSLFYSLNNTFIPTIISLVATVFHIFLNISLMATYKAHGLLLAGFLASSLQTFFYLITLYFYCGYPLYLKHLFIFIFGFMAQLLFYGFFFYITYTAVIQQAQASFPFFVDTIGLWLWVGPLIGIIILSMLFSRKFFGIKLYFLD